MGLRLLLLIFTVTTILVGCEVPGRDDPGCGDGIREAKEACDGSDLGEQNCYTLGFLDYTAPLKCTAGCTFDTQACGARCGDGIIEPQYENCEGDDFGGYTCESLGSAGGQLVCNERCLIDTTECDPFCGDGRIDSPQEACDGSSIPPESSCRNLGFFSGRARCTPECTLDSSPCWNVAHASAGPWSSCFFDDSDHPHCTGNHACWPLHDGEIALELVLEEYFGCALLPEGVVQCCGPIVSMPCADGDCEPPALVTDVQDAVELVAGLFHVCVRILDGTVRCWGSNLSGELGIGTDDDAAGVVTAIGINTAVRLTAADSHTCALLADGTVRCWGRRSTAGLGNGTNSPLFSPTTVIAVNGAVDVQTSDTHTCALFPDGHLRCWGQNHFGQLGDGTTIDRLAPVPVVGAPPAVSMAVGWGFTCMLDADGDVFCWGQYSLVKHLPQHGDDDYERLASLTPVRLAQLTSVEALVASRHACAVSAGGARVQCWGDGSGSQYGQYFDGWGDLYPEDLRPDY